MGGAQFSSRKCSGPKLAGGSFTYPNLFVRSLGAPLDPSLLLESQVTAVAREAYYQLRQVQQPLPCLDKKALATMVIPQLYVGLPLKTTRTFTQLVQTAELSLSSLVQLLYWGFQ